MVSLILPVPPSVNAAYRNVPMRGRVKTAAYKEWLKEADAAYLQQKRHVNPVDGPYTLSILLPHGIRGDVSNRIKIAEDFLVSRKITPDDSKCQRVSAERSFQIDIGLCVIQVEAA